MKPTPVRLVGIGVMSAMGLTLFALSCVDPTVESQHPFPLWGGHRLAQCDQCHDDDNGDPMPFADAESGCVHCHENTAPNPPHYGPTCENCHTVAGWGDLHYENHLLDLSGKHEPLACLDCHMEGDFSTLELACSSCHEDDRKNPTTHYVNQDCADCHVVAGWSVGISHNHDRFRVPHEGISECSDCHIATPPAFTCTGCHLGEHSKNKMDDEHDGENGYEWKDDKCLDCHPEGED